MNFEPEGVGSRASCRDAACRTCDKRNIDPIRGPSESLHVPWYRLLRLLNQLNMPSSHVMVYLCRKFEATISLLII